MYRLDWFERRRSQGNAPREPVNPVVWKLGFTSMLTDISSEMVSSVLPIYLVLHLHMSAFQYGAIDGIYNGVAVVFLSLVGGVIADRTRRPKEVAAVGYGLSAICKLLLFAAGSAWGSIAGVVAVDRTGKGIRTAPRDAIISLSTPRQSLAGAFALHRALDAGGALLGPILAFAILSRMPVAFDAIWLTSFVFAILGFAVLWLFVENPKYAAEAEPVAIPWRKALGKLSGRGFWKLAAIGALLSAMTVSDGFLYLHLQQRSEVSIGMFPLFYVATACVYMLAAIPIGRAADRYGRLRFLLLGYGAMGLIYVVLLCPFIPSLHATVVSLFLLGIYYAASDGVLLSMASAVIPPEYRTRGIAVLATVVGLGKLASSLLFGWLSQTHGNEVTIAVFAVGLAGTVLTSIYWLRHSAYGRFAQQN